MKIGKKKAVIIAALTIFLMMVFIPKVYAEIGIIMYSDQTAATISWRTIDTTTTISSATDITSLSDNEWWIECAASPTDPDRIICGAASNELTNGNGDLLSYMYDAGDNSMTALTTATSDVPIFNAKVFDVEFESTTGDALLVYIEDAGSGTLGYRTMGSGDSDWSSESTLTTTDDDNGYWLVLARDPASDDIMLGLEEDNAAGATLTTRLWSGTGWGSATDHGDTGLTDGIKLTQDFDIAWEGDTSEAIMVWNEPEDGVTAEVSDIQYETFTGGSWDGANEYSNNENSKVKQINIVLATEYAGLHDDVGLCFIPGNYKKMKCDVWTGAAWDGQDDQTIQGETGKGGLGNFHLAWSYDATDPDLVALVVGKDNEVQHVSYDQSASTWSTKATITSSLTQPKGRVLVAADPNSDAMITVWEEDKGTAPYSFDTSVQQCSTTCKTSTNWNSDSAITADAVKSVNQPFGVAFLDGTQAASNPTYTQNDFEWFVTANSVTLTNVWPPGNGENLAENSALTQIPSANETLTDGDQIRIQMNFTVATATLSASTQAFKLWYDADEDCTTASGWTAVGAKASGSIWRLFDEASIGDSTTQVNNISTSTASAEGYYSEIIPSGTNPSEVLVTENSEWDWPVENNGATANTTYCFRMTLSDDTAFGTYNSDSYPKLTTAPGPGDLMRHGKFFQNGTKQGFFW